MKNLVLKRIREMKAYKPPLAGRSAYPGVLLDFNERTTPLSAKVLKPVVEFFKSGKCNIYPEYSLLEGEIAEYCGVSGDQILLTNGSDQGIELVFRIFTEAGSKVIIPSPSFAMFYQIAESVGNDIIKPKFTSVDLAFPLKEVLKVIDEDVRLVVICNPNNPTGTLLDLESVGKIAKKLKNGIVLVDEAYFEFSGVTAVGLIKKCSNVIVSRSFSKAFGLASFRAGYLVANKKYVQELLKVRGPYDINMPAYIAATSALANRLEMEVYAGEVMNRAKPLVEDFFRKNGIKFYESAANFIVFKPKNASDFENLAAGGFLLRPQYKNIKGALRVSIGTFENMRKFVEFYQNLLSK